MNKRNDEIKALRIEQENNHIDIDLVEDLAKKVTDDLVEWANTNVFKGLGGELSLEIPTFGEPNARAITYWDKPYSPVIEIRLSMFQEIYRDAFTFPLISKRIKEETDNIDSFNRIFSSHFDARYMFSEGVPELPIETLCGNLKLHTLAFLEVYKTNPHEKLNENDIVFRFVMFEIVTAWVFFHELGHIVQRHYMIKNSAPNDIQTEILEIRKNGDDIAPDVAGQAREIMADAEGVDLTLKYMRRKGIFNQQSLYVLLCGVSCMYQRFYQNYDTNLDLSRGVHPHPVIRNEFFHSYILQWMIEFLGKDKTTYALPLGYISVRSSLMSGLFWAHRIESFDGEGLPTFMNLSSQNYDTQRKEYMVKIAKEVVKTISIVKNTHVLHKNCIAVLEKSLTSLSS